MENFQELLIALRKKDEVNSFLRDFLSTSERLMFAKRLAITLLLAKGYKYESIRQILSVSPATVYKMQQLFERGGYNVTLKKLAEHEAMKEFWKGVREVIHTIGKGRKVFG